MGKRLFYRLETSLMFTNWWQLPFSWGRHLKSRIWERSWTLGTFTIALHISISKDANDPQLFWLITWQGKGVPAGASWGSRWEGVKCDAHMRPCLVWCQEGTSPCDTHGRKGERVAFTYDPELDLELSENRCMKTSGWCATEDRKASALPGLIKAGVKSNTEGTF